MKLVALFVAVATYVNALESSEAAAGELTLKDRIAMSLEAAQESSAMGIENCENKCDKVFNKMGKFLVSSVNESGRITNPIISVLG